MVYGTSEYLPTVVPTIVLVLRTVLVPTRKYFYGTYRMIVRRTYNSTYYVVLYYLYPIFLILVKKPPHFTYVVPVLCTYWYKLKSFTHTESGSKCEAQFP